MHLKALANIWAVLEDFIQWDSIALFQPVPDPLIKRLRRLELYLIENHPRLALETCFFSVVMKHRLVATRGFSLWFEGLRTSLITLRLGRLSLVCCRYAVTLYGTFSDSGACTVQAPVSLRDDTKRLESQGYKKRGKFQLTPTYLETTISGMRLFGAVKLLSFQLSCIQNVKHIR